MFLQLFVVVLAAMAAGTSCLHRHRIRQTTVRDQHQLIRSDSCRKCKSLIHFQSLNISKIQQITLLGLQNGRWGLPGPPECQKVVQRGARWVQGVTKRIPQDPKEPAGAPFGVVWESLGARGTPQAAQKSPPSAAEVGQMTLKK